MIQRLDDAGLGFMIYLGENLQYFGHGPVYIDDDKHAALIGATGTGKSTVLKRLVAGDIRAGHGVCVIDPHGELVDRLCCSIPKSVPHTDVIVFNPVSPKVIGLNIFSGEDRQVALETFIKIVSTIWRDAWGAQSDYICRNIGQSIIEYEANPTVLHFVKAVNRKEYRKTLQENSTSPTVRDFFTTFDEEWDDRQREQALAPLRNKLDSFVSSPVLQCVIGQADSLDFSEIMNSGKILLCRFSKADLGPDAPAFLASVVLSKILSAALNRSKHPGEWKLFKVYADEFHNLSRGEAPAYLLSETRKYRVAFCIADQTIEQLPEGSEQAIFGNISTLMVGRAGAEDSRRLHKELGLDSDTVLTRLNLGQWYVKTVRQGNASAPMLIQSAPELEKTGDEQSAYVMRKQSLRNYGKPRGAVEEKLNRFLAA